MWRDIPTPAALCLPGRQNLQMQKSLLIEQAFRIWSVPEDNSPLRGSPCGPLLAQRSLAAARVEPPCPPEVLILFLAQKTKNPTLRLGFSKFGR